MTNTLNIRIRGVVHAHARTNEQITRCGTRYYRNGQYVLNDASDRPMGHRTNNGVECMTCLVKDEWAHADIREIIVSNSVKDLQEAVDVWYVDSIERNIK
jgi:hypothetical protein